MAEINNHEIAKSYMVRHVHKARVIPEMKTANSLHGYLLIIFQVFGAW